MFAAAAASRWRSASRTRSVLDAKRLAAGSVHRRILALGAIARTNRSRPPSHAGRNCSRRRPDASCELSRANASGTPTTTPPASSLSPTRFHASAPTTTRAPAGHESGGVLRLDPLEARLGRWYPQADSGPSEPIEAFTERGHRPLVPGPLVRVRAGTRIEITLRNTLASKTLVVYGLHTRPGSSHDTIQVAPGTVREVRFTAGEPGTYFYWGSTTGDDIDTRKGIDSQLSGAIIVDSARSAGADRKPLDRVFVIGVWHADPDTTGPKPWVERDQMVINGKSWPFTERFTYSVGDTVRWRWLNPTGDAHTMHLHGFFYTIESAGTWSGDTVYALADRRAVVTEMMLPGTTMAIRWVPREPGNWLFHCHFPFHVSTFLSLNNVPDASHPEATGHDVHGMAGMVLGVHVLPPHHVTTSEPARASAVPASRAIRLLIQRAPARFVVQSGLATFDTAAGYGFVVDDLTTRIPLDSVPVVSPTLVLRRGQPV